MQLFEVNAVIFIISHQRQSFKLWHNKRMKTLRDYIFVAAALFYMVTAFFWSMPDSFALKTIVINPGAAFFQWSGLWQNWAMFAPNPVAEDVYVSATAFFTDGSTAVWKLNKMDEMSYATRYAKERWRKWGSDNLRQDSYRALWLPGADFIARKMGKEHSKKVTKLNLTRHWHPVTVPFNNDVLQNRGPWQQFVFYTLDNADRHEK